LFTTAENFGKSERGELLASFQLLPPEQASSPVPNIKPASKDAAISVGVIGLRNLLPYALQPIQNPYVEFRCGKDPPVRTKPSKRPTGTNPNFLENLEIPVKLPIDPIYSPVVEVKVFDNRIIYKPLIGATSINIDKLLPWAKGEEIEEIPDNAEIPHIPPQEAGNPVKGIEPAATLVEVQDPGGESGWFEGKEKGKGPGIEMRSSLIPKEVKEGNEEEGGAEKKEEEIIQIEPPREPDASSPLLAGTKKGKGIIINLPSILLW